MSEGLLDSEQNRNNPFIRDFLRRQGFNVDQSIQSKESIDPEAIAKVTAPRVIRNGLARTNRFVATIFAPFAPTYSIVEIESAEMPSLSISTADFRYDQSPNVLVPYQRTPRGLVNLVVRLDEEHQFRKIINSWMEEIINIPSNMASLYGYSKNYYRDIIGTVSIYQLNLQGKVTSYMTLLNAYPTNIDSINFDWNDPDNFVRMNVTFTYVDIINKFL